MKRLLMLLSTLLALTAVATPSLAAEPDEKPAADAKKPDAKADAKPGAKAEDKGDADEDLPAKHPVVTYTVDIDLESLAKFDLAQGSVAAEFIMEVHCDKAPCDPHLEIGNGKLSGKPEKISEDELSRKYRIKAELDSFIDLSGYPFDSHELQLELYEKKDPFQTKIKVGEVSQSERLRLPGWEFDDKPHVAIEQLDSGDKTKQDQFVLSMGIHRPKMPQTFKSLVPVFFMLLVAAVGLALRPKSIGPRFAASTGGLVPLVMFHVGQINSLPSVGYLTRLDKFMMASYVAFLIHIVFNLLIMRSEEVKTEEKSAKLYKAAAVAVPLFTVVLWVIALFV